MGEDASSATGWRKHLHLGGKGSFRGLEFFVLEVSSEVGRRTVLHEFPGQDKPTVEDMGRRSRKFRLDAYVLGDNYMYERDQLRVEFEKDGPGTLVHPYWGTMTVTVDGGVQITESTDEGGLAKFTLNVIESGAVLAPIATPDTAALVELKVVAAALAVVDAFAAVYAVAGFIADVYNAALAVVNTITSTVNKISGKIKSVLNKIDAVGDAIASFGAAVATLISLPSQLAAAVDGLVADVIGSLDKIGDAWDDYFGDDEAPGDTAGTPSKAPTGASPASGDTRATMLLEHLATMTAFGSTLATVVQTTPQRVQQAANQAALMTLVRSTGVIYACKSAAAIPYASYEAAASMRDALVDQLDILAEATTDDASYAALVDLRAAVFHHLTSASADLPRIIGYLPPRTLPALVIAQKLYDDSTRDREIIDRNNVRNPCQVPGGVELEVLSDT